MEGAWNKGCAGPPHSWRFGHALTQPRLPGDGLGMNVCLIAFFRRLSEPRVSTLGSDPSRAKADCSHAPPPPQLHLFSRAPRYALRCLMRGRLRHLIGLSPDTFYLHQLGEYWANYWSRPLGRSRVTIVLKGPQNPESHFGSPASPWTNQAVGTTSRPLALPRDRHCPPILLQSRPSTASSSPRRRGGGRQGAGRRAGGGEGASGAWFGGGGGARGLGGTGRARLQLRTPRARAAAAAAAPRAPVGAPARPCALSLAAPLQPATMGARPLPLLSTLLLPLLAGESPREPGVPS